MMKMAKTAHLAVWHDGVYAYDDGGKEILSMKFPEEERVERLYQLMYEKKVPDELIKLIEKLKKKGYKNFTIENIDIANQLKEVDYKYPNVAGEILRKERRKEDIFDISVKLASVGVKRELSRGDVVIVRAMRTLQELNEVINTLMSSLREWYGIYFPELCRFVRTEALAKILEETGGKREAFTEENLEDLLPKSIASKIADMAEKSMGREVSEEEIKPLIELASLLVKLMEYRERLEDFIDECMRKEAPNLREVAGPLLGAQLISSFKGLGKLAMKSASTIQIWGAEKALFRHLRRGTSPPKHGIIFQHVLVRKAPKDIRGKIARAVANMIALAARIDYYTKRNLGKELREKLEKKVKRIYEEAGR